LAVLRCHEEQAAALVRDGGLRQSRQAEAPAATAANGERRRANTDEEVVMADPAPFVAIRWKRHQGRKELNSRNERKAVA